MRKSARLVLIDPQGRLLLLRYEDEQKPPFWSTAGGELRPGETYRDAAARELHEETGFEDRIGRLLRSREEIYAVARSQPACWQERYFLVECNHSDAPCREGWTEEERATIRDWKWWSLAEMRTGVAVCLPEWLPDLFEETLRALATENRGA